MPGDGITRADAAALFTEAVAPQVIEKATKSSVALATIPTIPMGSATTRMPVLAALPTGAFLTADQAVKPQSEAGWDKVILTAEEVAVIVPISETVIADSGGVDIVGKVTDLIGQEFARVIDAAVFFGTGAPSTWPVGGLDGVADTAGQELASTSNPAADFNALIGALEALGYDPTDVYAKRALRSALRGQTGTGGVPVYNPLDGSVATTSIYGVPLSFPLAWDAAKADALVIDDSGVVIGLRQDIQVKVLTEASLTGFGNLAEKDSIAVRATMRLGFQVANPVNLQAGGRKFPVYRLTPDVTP